jgi:hypothetical protein
MLLSPPQDETLPQQGRQETLQAPTQKKAKPMWRGADFTTRKPQSDPVRPSYTCNMPPHPVFHN